MQCSKDTGLGDKRMSRKHQENIKVLENAA